MNTLFSSSTSRSVLGVLAVFSGLAAIPSLGVEAATITTTTYNLDCPISSGRCTQDPNRSWGTVTLTERGTGQVGISIDLTGSVNKVLKAFMNYNDGKFTNATAFRLDRNYLNAQGNPVTVANTITVKEDSTNSPGGGKGFDLELTGTGGNFNVFDQYNGVIKIANNPTPLLTADDFKFKTDGSGTKLGSVYLAVHIGNYGIEPGQGGQNSITVGAVTPPKVVSKKVPLPPVVLGLAVSGIFGAWKLKRQSSKQSAKSAS